MIITGIKFVHVCINNHYVCTYMYETHGWMLAGSHSHNVLQIINIHMHCQPMHANPMSLAYELSY